LVPVGSEFILLHIWDMTGQEKFKAISRAYFRNAVSAVLVFDAPDLSSFDAMSMWLEELQGNCVPNVYIIFVVVKGKANPLIH
jgi:GTPase SAR1 family protein